MGSERERTAGRTPLRPERSGGIRHLGGSLRRRRQKPRASRRPAQRRPVAAAPERDRQRRGRQAGEQRRQQRDPREAVAGRGRRARRPADRDGRIVVDPAKPSSTVYVQRPASGKTARASYTPGARRLRRPRARSCPSPPFVSMIEGSTPSSGVRPCCRIVISTCHGAPGSEAVRRRAERHRRPAAGKRCRPAAPAVLPPPRRRSTVHACPRSFVGRRMRPVYARRRGEVPRLRRRPAPRAGRSARRSRGSSARRRSSGRSCAARRGPSRATRPAGRRSSRS